MSPRAVLDDAERAQRSVWRPRDAEDTTPHYVYRCYDAADQLLYIGCCRDVESRIYMHLVTCTMPGWGEMRRRYARHTSERYPNKKAARAAERQAIHDEAPLLNRQHNPKRWKRVGGEYVPVEQQAVTA